MITDQDILSARILIVDDSQTIIDLLVRILNRAGYKAIVGTTDPREAGGLYEALKPDLVILDINMPHLDGFEVLGRLREIDRSAYLPVLVLTAQQDKETRIQALSSGAKDFLAKPVDQVEALTRIRNLLEVRLLHNHLRNQNRELEQKVQDRTRELHDTRLEIIRRLGRAAEYRDNETGLHIIRMSQMSSLLGARAGMTDGEAELLLNASPMHDIGKIGIPDRILLKPGKLDPREWKIMKTHTTIGERILSGHDSELMNMARTIALTHHERWDGGGYPHGIGGTEIPFVGRVTAVCDVFDALISERPYKKPWPRRKALAELDRGAGKQFDPDLVKGFKELLPEVDRIMKRYREPTRRSKPIPSV